MCVTSIRLGAKLTGKEINLPGAFKALGYSVEIIRSILIFIPFVYLALPYQLWQIGLLILLTLLIFFSIYRLFSVKKFVRDEIRKFVGISVIFMYATTPIMLSSLNLYFVLLAFVPPLWFVFSNRLLHQTFLEPQTM